MGKSKKELETPVADMVVEKKKKEPKKIEKLGTRNHATLVTYHGKRLVNNKEYHDIHLADGTTYLLSDEDVNSQLIVEIIEES